MKDQARSVPQHSEKQQSKLCPDFAILLQKYLSTQVNYFNDHKTFGYFHGIILYDATL